MNFSVFAEKENPVSADGEIKIETDAPAEAESEIEKIEEIEEENNENLYIENVVPMSAEDRRTELGALLDGIGNCNPSEVADADSLKALESAAADAENVYKNDNASEEDITKAIEDIKAAISKMKYVSGMNILTNNQLSDSEKESFYPELLGEESTLAFFETDATYTYSDGSPIASLDAKNNKLFDGLLNGTASKTMTTAANVTDPTEIVYDLGTEYFVCGADVFSQFFYLKDQASFRRNIKGFKLEASADGSEYKTIAEANAKTTLSDGETTARYEIKTSADFPAVSARYVKITVSCDENSTRYNLNEVVIKGFKSPYSRDDLYDALKKCTGVDSSVNTAQSYNAYVSAYKKAEQIYWDSNASGREIYEAKLELENAYAALEKQIEVKILSGNVVSEFDKKTYGDYKNDTLDLSYTYLEDSNPQIMSQDSNHTRLLQGGCEQLTTSTLVYGTWDSPRPANILFDMGEECYVSGVDVWEYYISNSTRTDKVTVSVSSDGKNFTEASQTQNTKNDDEKQVSNCISQDFEAAKCRYLLVSVEKGSSHQITLNEVVIKGCRIPQEAQNCYSFGVFDYKNQSGSRVISADGNDKLVVSGSVKSSFADSRDVVVITAAYKNNMLAAWDAQAVHTSPYGTAEFKNTLDTNSENGYEIYTFVWDSLFGGLALSQQKPFGTL